MQEVVKYQYWKVDIGMPIFMHDMAAAVTTYNIRIEYIIVKQCILKKKMI